MDTYFIVGLLNHDVECKTDTHTTRVKLGWAPGMIGALPVFDTRKAAEIHAMAHNGAAIIEVQVAPAIK